MDDYLGALRELEDSKSPDLTVDEVARRHSSNLRWDRELKNNLRRRKAMGVTPPGKPPPLAVRLEEALPFRRVIDDLLSMNREVQKRRSTCESGKANRT